MSKHNNKNQKNYNASKRTKVQREVAKEQFKEVMYEEVEELCEEIPVEEVSAEDDSLEIITLDDLSTEREPEDTEEEQYEESESEEYEEEYEESESEEYEECEESESEEVENTVVEESVAEETEAELTETAFNWKKMLILPALLVFAAIVSVITIYLYEANFVYKLCRVEAGVNVSADDFTKKERINFVAGSDEIDITIPGEYNLIVNVGLFNHKCKLIIEDKIAPVVNVLPVTIEYGQTCKVEDFVESIEDATKTTIAFVEDPDYSLKGEQAVKIVVTDAGNNSTTVDCKLMVSAVVSELNVEIGSGAPAASDFVISGEKIELITDLNAIDYSVLGSHEVEIVVDDIAHKVSMNITDTVAPEVELQDISGYTIVPRTAESFVVSGSDATAVTYAFETEPDLTLVGTQQVTIVATDECGNQTKKNAGLTLEADTEAPVITSINDIIVIIGNSVSYKSNIKATDNCPEGLEILVDSSAVNLNAVGTYPVTYTVKDCAGNAVSETVELTVMEQTYDIETVNALCDKVLAQIIDEGMTQKEKALAIFNYTRSHVSYISHSEKGNYVRAAYEGLAEGQGDCYVFACVSKVLLTRAGITNMDIEKIRINGTMHFWNLVDIGDGWGWYHYDATPRKDGTKFFLWTDTPLRAYSDSHNDSHNYDPELYPEIKP